MRKYFLFTSAIFFAAILFLTGCQKEIAEPPAKDGTEDAIATDNTANRGSRGNSCRLVTLDWPTVGKWQFNYNDKGLADLWTIDYGPEYPLHTNVMTYDKNDRLVKSIENYFGSIYEYGFYYTGKRLTRVTRVNVDVPEDAVDFTYTYNWKGQNIRQDDNTHDQHVLMYYDAIGNCTRMDLYFGTDLVYSDNYTFYAPVKNPRQNIPGVETGFPFYGTGGVTDKWWFTSNKTISAYDGNPTLFNDYNPFKTRIKTGNSNLPIYATYFDRVTESTINIDFDYDNCRGSSHWNNDRNSHSNRSTRQDKTIDYGPSLLVRGSSKSVREQIQKMKEYKGFK